MFDYIAPEAETNTTRKKAAKEEKESSNVK